MWLEHGLSLSQYAAAIPGVVGEGLILFCMQLVRRTHLFPVLQGEQAGAQLFSRR